MLKKYFFNFKVIISLLLLLINTSVVMANSGSVRINEDSSEDYVSKPIAYVSNGAHSLSEKISHLLAKHAQEYNVGILIQDAKTGKVLYAMNEDKLFTPASTTKLFPATAALIDLGEDFSFSTTIFTDSKNIKESVINNLYFKFSGDPELTTNKFYHLIATLKDNNITVIKGNIVVDDTLFAGPEFGSGWAWESNQWFYSPPITAAMINGNSIHLRIAPSKELGSNLHAKFVDVGIPSNLKLTSTIKAVTYEDSLEKCRLLIDANQNNNYMLSGCWPLNIDPGVLKLSIKNPSNYVKDLILSALKNENVQFSGNIIFGKIPQRSSLTRIAANNSDTLSKLLKRVLNHSDNVYTESLTKTLGAKHYQVGSFKSGVLAVKGVLQHRLGVNVHSVKIEDGSGLSRYNLISPRAFNDLLSKVYHNKNYYSFLSDCMKWPQSSRFLQSRVAALNYRAPVSIHAKTGTVSGVSTISGYLTTEHKRDIIFTIMINGVRGKQRVAKNLENKIILDLMKL